MADWNAALTDWLKPYHAHHRVQAYKGIDTLTDNGPAHMLLYKA